jgi:hypothetical protein
VAAGRPGTAATPPRAAGRPGRAASPPRATGQGDDEAEVGRALTLGRGLAIACLAVAVLLLVLGALGRGTPYLLGALDFAVLAAAFGWIGWRDPGGRRGP